MYSSSPRFQQKEPKNHSNGMNDHKNVEGDQTQIFTAPYICNNSRMASLHNFHFFIIATQFYFPNFKIPVANLDRKRFDF